LQLHSALIKVEHYPAGHTIGYGRAFTTPRPTVLGIVPIGYGDGYVRALSNNAAMAIAGRKVPVIGRVSMDLTAVDLTDLDEEPAVGDHVEVLGGEVSADDLAKRASTIPYETVTLLTRRIPRLYYRNGRIVSRQTLSGGYEELVPAAFEGLGGA
jgi:alanine racemase